MESVDSAQARLSFARSFLVITHATTFHFKVTEAMNSPWHLKNKVSSLRATLSLPSGSVVVCIIGLEGGVS